MRDSASALPMMVLCSACGDAIESDAPCSTCGEGEPQDRASGPIDHVALLDRVEVALKAQAELARQTAAQRTARAVELYDQALVLRARLQRQVSLMRRLIAERRELQASFGAPVGRVDSALAEPPARGPELRRVVNVLLPQDPSCQAVARRVLENHLNAEFDRQEALLVISELVSNALVHGSGRIELRAELGKERLRVEVSDEGEPAWIGVPTTVDAIGGGRGLWLVEHLSTAWGATSDPTRVWAELDLTRRPGA